MRRTSFTAGLAALAVGGAVLGLAMPAQAHQNGYTYYFAYGSPSFGGGHTYTGRPSYADDYGYGNGHRYDYQPYYDPLPLYYRAYEARIECAKSTIRVRTTYGWRWQTQRFCP